MKKRNAVQLLENYLKAEYGRTADNCTDEELFTALLVTVKDLAADCEEANARKKIYYISAEFLIGKLLSNNMINLGIYDEVKEYLAEHGKSLAAIEEAEPEPSLGNGGLGRLAACFLDSMASIGLAGDGIGLNYHLGLFQQVLEGKKQKETPNPWIEDPSWLTRKPQSYEVRFKDFTLKSVLYDIAVTGYENRTNQLHLFDIEQPDEAMVQDGISFDKAQIMKNLTLFLYPDDSDKAGELLRIYQQYFMVSNGAQLILEECVNRGCNLHDLPEYAVIQINDTHPSMVIPELIRLLTEKGIDMDEAIEIVSHTCAYTNHTILAEALEKWPISYLEETVPHLLPIIRVLDEKVKAKYPGTGTEIIDDQGRVHMAHMDIHYGFSVNGVAALHTEILKNSELKNFYKIYPDKFNNKTNGITFRRWLMHCDPELASFITEKIGDGWKKDAEELKNLLKYLGDQETADRLLEIKHQKKTELKEYLEKTQGIVLNEDSIFDIQVKRLHEYKRQQMNVLYVIDKYLEIKEGIYPKTPLTVIFGAKAAPAYILAKDIIHVICCLQELIRKDPVVSKYLNVVMIENYNVTKAEKVIPACDISEQISLASKEASGTGNMKFMLNGAVTLGTEDGANVEIHQFVGDENIYIFGKSSEEVIALYENGSYSSRQIYENDPEIRRDVDFLVGPEMMEIGDPENLRRLYEDILNKDWFMALLDLKEYIAVRNRALEDYEDRYAWAKKMLVNIANAGFFSSDRTIAQYNTDIWKLGE